MLIAYVLALLAMFTGAGSTHATAAHTMTGFSVHHTAVKATPTPNSAHALAG